MENTVTSFNWVVGTVAIFIGLAWPFINTKMVIPATRFEGEETIRLLANAERQVFDLKHNFVQFINSSLPNELAQKISIPNDRKYEYEAFLNEKGQLVLRAYSKPNVIPGIYELVMDNIGAIGNGKWVKLSSLQRSLFWGKGQ